MEHPIARHDRTRRRPAPGPKDSAAFIAAGAPLLQGMAARMGRCGTRCLAWPDAQEARPGPKDSAAFIAAGRRAYKAWRPGWGDAAPDARHGRARRRPAPGPKDGAAFIAAGAPLLRGGCRNAPLILPISAYRSSVQEWIATPTARNDGRPDQPFLTNSDFRPIAPMPSILQSMS